MLCGVKTPIRPCVTLSKTYQDDQNLLRLCATQELVPDDAIIINEHGKVVSQ